MSAFCSYNVSMFTYKKLLDQTEFLLRSGIEVGAIGASEDGRIIPYIFVGDKNAPCIFITGGIHAREHVSSYCVMRQAEYAINAFKKKSALGAAKAVAGGIYFIPMLNPDGNEIIARGVYSIKRCDTSLLYEIFKNTPRGLFKANARGVDLNTNFDARFGTGIHNVFKPAFANYVGTHAFSELETRCLRDFTLAKKPQASVSYHCLGRELYWEFGQKEEERLRDRAIAEYLNSKLGYVMVGDDGTSSGGYKDWCISALRIPSFTIELGLDAFKHPFTEYSVAEDDIKRNLDLPLRLLSRVLE